MIDKISTVEVIQDVATGKHFTLIRVYTRINDSHNFTVTEPHLHGPFDNLMDAMINKYETEESWSKNYEVKH